MIYDGTSAYSFSVFLLVVLAPGCLCLNALDGLPHTTEPLVRSLASSMLSGLSAKEGEH